jgi:hypothetical protein
MIITANTHIHGLGLMSICWWQHEVWQERRNPTKQYIHVLCTLIGWNNPKWFESSQWRNTIRPVYSAPEQPRADPWSGKTKQVEKPQLIRNTVSFSWDYFHTPQSHPRGVDDIRRPCNDPRAVHENERCDCFTESLEPNEKRLFPNAKAKSQGAASDKSVQRPWILGSK